MNYNMNLVLAKPVSSTHTQVFGCGFWAGWVQVMLM